MELVSRDAAILLGEKRYYTGKPCKYGHVAQRLASRAIPAKENMTKSNVCWPDMPEVEK